MTTTIANYLTQTISGKSFYSITDNINSGIIFEFTPANVNASLQIDPLFETSTFDGFPNVSAITQLNISSSKLNNLFFFEGKSTQSVDGANNDLIPLRYGINTGFNFNFSYSESLLQYGSINTIGSQRLDNDYIRYLANAITGGYNLTDIFANEQELINGVDAMDISFNTILNNAFLTALDPSTDESTESSIDIITIENETYTVYSDIFSANMNNYIKSSKSLLDGLLSIQHTNRGKQFFEDISAQKGTSDALSSYYYIPFHSGDMLSILLNYVPKNGNGQSFPFIDDKPTLGINPIFTRTYKIVLNCVG